MFTHALTPTQVLSSSASLTASLTCLFVLLPIHSLLHLLLTSTHHPIHSLTSPQDDRGHTNTSTGCVQPPLLYRRIDHPIHPPTQPPTHTPSHPHTYPPPTHPPTHSTPRRSRPHECFEIWRFAGPSLLRHDDTVLTGTMATGVAVGLPWEVSKTVGSVCVEPCVRKPISSLCEPSPHYRTVRYV
jgi:hypothetical protein